VDASRRCERQCIDAECVVREITATYSNPELNHRTQVSEHHGDSWKRPECDALSAARRAERRSRGARKHKAPPIQRRPNRAELPAFEARRVESSE